MHILIRRCGRRWKIHGISGSNVVGSYINTSGVYRGFLYNTSNQIWTILPITASAIDGIYVIGGSHQIYNLTTKVLATITVPSQFSRNTTFAGISGNNIVGKYSSIDTRGFIFNLNSQTWTSINKPGAWWTDARGIDGSNVVGCYYDSYGMHGFTYSMTTQEWITVDVSGATSIYLNGISGSKIVGIYEDVYGSHAFLYTFAIPADLNADGKVDMLDYVMLANQWQNAPGVPSADIAPSGGDGFVDFKDLAVMLQEWLEGV